ncbi:AsnC family protein [Desulfospira joergensenii]|uniref:AsnC family protein n=1 Tax=Desulfospira joergensenii TaxID=53329 RepID=UPI0003B6BC59|nr:AsnC family protein [Desulfospira joergensenii]
MALIDYNLDDIEINIIKALQIDARRPYKSIAKDLGVSEGIIDNRVNRLLKKISLTWKSA